MSALAITQTKNSSSPRPWIGWALAAAATVAFSSGTPIGKAAITAGINPTAFLAVRFLLTTILFTVTFAVSSPQVFRIDLRGLIICSLAGLSGSGAILSYFWALRDVNGSLSAMVVSLYPLLVLVLLALRGEKFTSRNLVRVTLGLAGIYLLIGPGGNVSSRGLLLLLGAAISFAIHIVMIQWYLGVYQSRTVTYYVTTSMTFVMVFAWLLGGFAWSDPGVAGWISIGFMAIVTTYLAGLAFYGAIRLIGGGQMALFGPAETLLSVGWSILFLGERLAPLQLAGSFLIILSAAFAVRRLKRVAPGLEWLEPSPQAPTILMRANVSRSNGTLRMSTRSASDPQYPVSNLILDVDVHETSKFHELVKSYQHGLLIENEVHKVNGTHHTHRAADQPKIARSTHE